MAKKQITFRLTAFSAAAGKYDPAAPLDGNEDNFYVDDDLSDDILGRFQGDEDIVMSDCGCLMVVADGMGGMNAGEVASAIAVETVRDAFAPGKVTTKMAESPAERKRYLENVIKEADRRIKRDAKENPTHEGMGSTIILAWIVGDKMTISWCGDSRAYRFNPLNGLEPLSRDHSYVQELVNQGTLTYEDTFEHPQGNIITRSLGDPNHAAEPETRQFDVYNDDIILLCSDGLSGVLRDRKTKDRNGAYYPGENIEDIIARHTSSMTECRDALMEAAEKADWYDNVTVLLCQIESGAGKAPKCKAKSDDTANKKKSSLKNKLIIGIACAIALFALLCGCYYLGLQKGESSQKDNNRAAQADSVKGLDIVRGEDIVANDDSHSETADKNRGENTGENKKNITPGVENPVKETQQSESPANNGVAQWKKSLLSELGKYSQPALKKVVAHIEKTINTAGNDDMDKCMGLIIQLEKRAAYLNELRQFNGILTRAGQKKFDAILKEIGDPNKFTPRDWADAIPALKKYIARGQSGFTEELTPAGGSGAGVDPETPESQEEQTEKN